MAMTTTSVRRVFMLTIRDVAEILSVEGDSYITYDFESWRELSQICWGSDEKDDYKWINCVNFHLMVPKIVRLNQFSKLPYRKTRLTKRNLYARDKNKCQYCGKEFPASKLSIDHVMPKSRGGKSTWENIVCACVPCNTRKDNRTPHQAGMKLIENPKTPRLSPTLIKHVETNPEWKLFVN